MKQIIFLFLSFLIQSAIADESLEEQMDNILNSELPESKITFEDNSFSNPPVYIYRGGSYYSTGRYCEYPYPHIRSFGHCPYYPTVNFTWRINPGKRMNAVERSIADLFDQAFFGKAKAQYSLGIRYHQGTMGLPKNLSEAYAWFSVALQNEHQSAQYWIDKLMDQMMANEMAEGEQKADWIQEEIIKNKQEHHNWLRENLLIHNYNFTEEDHPQEQSALHDQHTHTEDE